MSRNLKVNGPISGYTVDYGNKRYLLMGDYHSVGSWGLCDCTTQLNCMNVVELIKKIADQAVESEKYVDIFLEANTYRTTDINPKIVPEFPTIRNADILAKKIKEAPLNPTYETQWLYQLEKWFLKENCFDINKKECPWYPNVRFHWADPRSARIRTEDIPYVKMKRDQRYVQKGGDGEDFSYELMEKIKTEDDLFSIADALIEMAKISKKFYMDYVVPYKEFDFMNAVEDLVEELEIKESNPYFDDIWTHFFEKSQNIPTAFRDGIYISKIAIQLEELRKENPQLANEIIEYFNKHFDNVIKNIKGYKRFAIAVAKNPKSKPILADNYFKKKIVNSFEWHFTALMDLYALSRMLRKISREGNDSELVIVYAGDYHIGFYANFFEQIDGAKVQKHKNLIEDYISPKNKKLIKKLESFDFNPLELYDIHLKKIPYRCIEFKGFQKPSDFFPRRIKKRKLHSKGGGTFDISQIKDTVSSTNKNKNYIKIVLEENGLKIPGYIVTPDKDGFILLLSENPISQFIDTYDNEIVGVFDDSFTDSCLIMEIDLENHFSHISNLSNKSCGPYVKYGQQVMELVHKINRELDIKKSTLEDYSRSEKTKIPLRFYNVIKNGETWYERQGFPLDEQEKKQKEVFLGLKTEDILKRYGNRYPPHLVSAIRETYEPVFHKALNQIMNKFDISSLLEPFEEEGYFVTHEKNY